MNGPTHTLTVEGQTVCVWDSHHALPPDHSVGPATNSRWLRIGDTWHRLERRPCHHIREWLDVCDTLADVMELTNGYTVPALEVSS